MKMGMGLEAALAEAMRDLWALEDPYYGDLSIVAIDAAGNPGAASNAAGSRYIYQTEGMASFAEQPRTIVARQ